MTRGLPHALCRLLALLACVMCGQPASRVMAAPSVHPGAAVALLSAGAEAGSGEGSVSTSGAPAGPEADPLPGTESSRQERESDDDEDQDDDFDDAQPLGLRGTLWGTPSLMASFGATPSHDPACSNHRLLDPRPPRRR